ncbi:CPBP family intramembrane glutamic endopeptidase [Natranaeroarchaeum aerophilus]|uniref:CPBP family intramembrane metalloprotease n=1 Tax=Natranaeroarchaeum aerophilus TaxID=2917711 RepID=A0AAE3FQ33_9EURY|nr:type II CAAX endopeptidase family protein [Natranaeroarchaeum aerophilus]MCL9813030.1 CPBP family intramembrane metalloprotease [Natranaeroarchaeum aerophilus]
MDRERFVDMGIACAALTAAVTLQPWPSPAVVDDSLPIPVSPPLVATAFALLALAGFLGRRYGWLGRWTGVVATVGGSTGAVIPSVSVIVVLTDAGIAVSIWPPLAVGLGVTTGVIGMVDWAELRVDDLLDRLDTLLVASIVAVTAVLATGIFDVLVGSITTALLAVDRGLADAVTGQLAAAAGLWLVVVVYLYWREGGITSIDLRWLDTRDLLYCLGGFIGLLLVLLLSAELLAGLGVPSSPSGVTEGAPEPRPELFLAVLLISALLVGPVEELLFRSVIQRSLYSSFTRASSVVLSSILYAAIYLPAYATAPFSVALAGLSLAFTLSLVLAVTYARTDNVLVPALIHGAFNAFQYAVLYVAVVHEVGVG